jgi:putative aldouronate transport system substrate-binding protein
MGNTYHWKIPVNDKDNLITFNALELQKVNEAAYKELAFGQPPVGPTGKRGIPQEPLIQGAMSLFGKQLEKEPDKFGMLLKFYDFVHSSYENFLTATYGFEGKTYIWENNAVKPINGYEDLKKQQGAGGNTNTTLGSLPFVFGQKMFSSQTEFARKYKMNENGVRNELIGGLPSSGKYSTELNKIQSEAYLSIIDGSKPISYFDEFVKNWKTAGGDQLTKEANEWFSNIK